MSPMLDRMDLTICSYAIIVFTSMCNSCDPSQLVVRRPIEDDRSVHSVSNIRRVNRVLEDYSSSALCHMRFLHSTVVQEAKYTPSSSTFLLQHRNYDN